MVLGLRSSRNLRFQAGIHHNRDGIRLLATLPEQEGIFSMQYLIAICHGIANAIVANGDEYQPKIYARQPYITISIYLQTINTELISEL